MTIEGFNSYYNPYYQSNIGFKNNQNKNQNKSSIIDKPVEKVENVINKTVDTFVKTEENEEKKKSHRTAITVGSTVLVIGSLMALLNPKFSGKLINKMRKNASKANAEAIKGSKGSFKNQFNQFKSDILSFGADCFQFTNTINAWKDQAFKWLCADKKSFSCIKNETANNILRKIDNGFTTIMRKPHTAITNGFDAISKHTVYSKYAGASKKLDELENLIQSYKAKMPYSKQLELENKLKEISKAREYFSKNQVDSRLQEQEKLMSNLEKDFRDKFQEYRKNFKWFNSEGTFKEKSKHNYQNFRENMSYWAEDIMMPDRNRLEQNGKDIVNNILGDGKAQQGKYHEVIDMLSPFISKDEKLALESTLRTSGKSLRKANFSETVEYFDKKRDLMLGGAPTDVLTALFGIGMSGVAIGTADTKEDRISRAITVAFPAVAGLGVSTALTAMLVSGAKSLGIGFASSIGLSMLGNTADKYLNPKKPTQNNLAKNQTNATNPTKTTATPQINQQQEVVKNA